jgi:hypothetical protein
MESGDIGSRRADCGSAGAVVCDVTALLPLTGSFVSSGSVPFTRDVTDAKRVHQSYTMVLVIKPYHTHDTLASPSVDSGSMSLISNNQHLHLLHRACSQSLPAASNAGRAPLLQGPASAGPRIGRAPHRQGPALAGTGGRGAPHRMSSAWAGPRISCWRA